MEFSRHFAADLNRDGNRDLLFASKGSLEVFLSLPAHPYAWIDVQTNGDRTNRAGIGTRVELYVGDLRIGGAAQPRDAAGVPPLAEDDVLDHAADRPAPATGPVEVGLAKGADQAEDIAAGSVDIGKDPVSEI